MLAYRRAHPRSAPFLSLTNFSDVSQAADPGIIARAGLRDARLAHASTVVDAGTPWIDPAPIVLAPWSFAWFSGT